MKQSITQWLWVAPVAVGVAFTISVTGSLKESGKLHYDKNPFAIERSAYGRLLARLSETTIDRVWHLGVEQIVPHNIPGHANSHTPGHLDHEDSHGEHEHGDGHTKSVASRAPKKTALEAAKDWFNEMRVAKYSRTNPYSLSEKHLATVQNEIEQMLLRSYKMDPTHYGAYNSYHLFLTTYDFGGNDQKRKHAKTVAEITIAEVFKEKEDPEPWLTAASAAMNLFLLETESYQIKGEPIPLEILKQYRSRIGYCLDRFETLQKKAEASGTWQNLSTERQIEITQRQRFSVRTFAQFDAMIARAEEAASTENETEVATSPENPDQE